MADMDIKPISSEEYSELMRLPSGHVYRECCATTGPDPEEMCGNPIIAYKVFINGWITKDPFNICRRCHSDWKTFGHLSLVHHPIEVIRGPHITVYPDIRALTVLRNTVDGRIRQKELTPKAFEIKEIKARA